MPAGDKVIPIGTRNQKVRGPFVRFGIKAGNLVVGSVNENIILAVQQDVRRFVEKSEP